MTPRELLLNKIRDAMPGYELMLETQEEIDAARNALSLAAAVDEAGEEGAKELSRRELGKRLLQRRDHVIAGTK